MVFENNVWRNSIQNITRLTPHAHTKSYCYKPTEVI